jgi:polyisoprenoid-binding protein YceI
MATWTIDPMHSDVNFKVRHLMISTVKGSFSSYEATIEGDETNGFADATFHFSADINSISTGAEQRDGHLKSAEFFNAEVYPKLTFASTGFKKTADGTFKLHGNLTIKDKTNPVVLDVVFNGIMVDFYGQTKAGFGITGAINRQEFGLTWSAVTEAGGVVLADEVKLELDVQMIKQA